GEEGAPVHALGQHQAGHLGEIGDLPADVRRLEGGVPEAPGLDHDWLPNCGTTQTTIWQANAAMPNAASGSKSGASRQSWGVSKITPVLLLRSVYGPNSRECPLLRHSRR